jgi:hypothetical protein
VTIRVAAKSSASKQLCQPTSAPIPTRSPSHAAGVVTATQTALTYRNIARPYTRMTRLLSLAHTQAANIETLALNASNGIAAKPVTAWPYTATHTNGPSTRGKSKCGAAQRVSRPAWFNTLSGENKAFNELRSSKKFHFLFLLLSCL